ncbi:MAG: (2Fe-2S)-binding protein [Candidatus Izemoplasmatales bacterium]|jgi:bacterioferritin-associated ferredoxin|nr:(2Fe-2S)-binding protein [Candidatus Izemoplasmatales bacterium]
MNKKDIIICRCEDINLEQIHDLLDQGYTTIEDIKRLLRIGMGPCQGKTCGLLLQQEIARYLKCKTEEVALPKIRPLVTGVKLKAIVEGTKDER